MNRRLALLALPALALACLLALPDSSFAQFRRGGFGRGGYGQGNYGGYGQGNYGGYGQGSYGGYGQGNYLGSPYGSGYNVNPYAYSSPIYNSGYTTVIPGSGVYQAAYPPQGAVQGQGTIDASRCYIHVHVPANAQVMFDNTPTQQTGMDRTFMSPALDNNQNYTYQISARWMDNGQQRNETRTVRLIQGQSVNVDFTSPQQGTQPQRFEQPNQPGTTGQPGQPRQQPNPLPALPRNNPNP
jgi:uncharacterized protein (TIGR03000 family)